MHPRKLNGTLLPHRRGEAARVMSYIFRPNKLCTDTHAAQLYRTQVEYWLAAACTDGGALDNINMRRLIKLGFYPY